MDPFGDPFQDQHGADGAAESSQPAESSRIAPAKPHSPSSDQDPNPPVGPSLTGLDSRFGSSLDAARTAQERPEGYDEPPASVMLDIDDGGEADPLRSSTNPVGGPQRPSSASKPSRMKASIFEQSRIPDEPQMGTRASVRSERSQRRTRRSYEEEEEGGGDDDDDVDDVAGLYSDEEAALMAREERANGYPKASASRGKAKARHVDRGNGRSSHRSFSDGRSSSSRSADGHRTRKRRGWDWSGALPSTSSRRRRMALGGLDAKQKALWMWANVDNMDAFLQEVYAYYLGKGAICIALSRALNLLTIAFVIGFSTFLLGCVDYAGIRHDGRLSEVIVGHCVSRFSNLSLLLFISFAAFYGWQVIQFGFGLSRLAAMHRFYTHLLCIPDADVQSIPWNEVVNRIAALREEHPITSYRSDEPEVGGEQAKEKLDAHDVANRIMRQENYLIALFNKDTLDLSVPGLRHRSPALTRSLEWNLNFCLLGFLFDSRGQVRRQFLTDRHRGQLIEGLRRRFLFMAIVNAVFAPFIVLYLVMYSFFRYFEEYHKDPSNLGSRQYTQYARWKFREFNELPHLFRRRCHSSYPYAQRYIDQFPKEKTAIAARFVAFIAGSFTAVLLLASVIDPDLFLHFDITSQRNVLFYIGLFGTVLAVSRGMIPDEHLVFEPEILLRAVIHHTHFMPEQWKGRFHSTDVHVEFGQLYTLKIYIFIQELLSVITTPFVLWLSLPKSAPAIIDFFREFTVHVDGIGYVCSFAVFNFRREGNAADALDGEEEGTHGARQGKMEQSILGFKANHPDWEPTDPISSLFLARMAAAGLEGLIPPGRRPEAGDADDAVANGLRQWPRAGEPDSKPFTPVQSTLLANRSQFYEEAFTRSIALARDKDNAAALAASTYKGRSGTTRPSQLSQPHPQPQRKQQQQRRSNSKGRLRSANDGTFSDRIIEEGEGEVDGDGDGSLAEGPAGGHRPGGDSAVGSSAEVRRGPGAGMDQSQFDVKSSGQTGVRDLLNHIYTGRGTPGGTRW